MKALLLSAGLGSRLLPYTLTTPKPLLPIGECRLIEYPLRALAAAGITIVVINVAYLHWQIMDFLGDGARYGIEIIYSQEGLQPLGVVGGMQRACQLLGEESFILLSSDVLMHYPLQSLLQIQTEGIHLVVAPKPAWRSKGDLQILPNGEVCLDSQEKPYVYISMAVVHPKLLQGLEPIAFAELLKIAKQRGQLTAQILQGPHFNVGTLNEWRMAESWGKSLTLA